MIDYTSLTLNDHYYNRDELFSYCTRQLNKNALDDYKKALHEFILQWLNQSDCIVLQTSGTTRSAKAIILRKADMVQSALLTGRYFSLTAGNNALLCLPTRYIAGQMMVVRAFVLQLNLITLAPAALSLKPVKNKPAHFAAMLPMQLQKLLDTNNDHFASINNIQTLLLGGTILPERLHKQLAQLDCNVYQSFAMTETISHFAIRKISPEYQTYYTLLDGFSISQDERGCLVVSSKDLNISHLVSNDIVQLHAHNQFTFLGRYDNVINSGGIKINPEFIEDILAPYITGRRFFVAGLADEQLGEKLILFIEGQDFCLDKKNKINQQINALLEKYYRPKNIIFINKFIDTGSGKIKRKESIQEIICNAVPILPPHQY